MLADYLDRAMRDAQDLLTRTFAGHKQRVQFLHHLAFRLRRYNSQKCVSKRWETR